MNVETVAKKFTGLLKKGDFESVEKLWSDDVVSIEMQDGPMKELRGREAVHGKGVWWTENHTIHNFETVGPFVNGDKFALIFRIDVTQKATGQRMSIEEVGLYTVKGDKVTEERFFNPPT
jgi:ketosteroid isomerase-like protein